MNWWSSLVSMWTRPVGPPSKPSVFFMDAWSRSRLWSWASVSSSRTLMSCALGAAMLGSSDNAAAVYILSS